MSGKRELLAIAEHVIRADGARGHLRWSVDSIARAEGISRSLVYYHFGKTKKDILLASFKLVAEQFYGLTKDRLDYSKVSLFDSLLLTHRMYKKNVIYAIFYQRWRSTPSFMQSQYLEIEARYRKKLKANFPRASEAQITAIHALFHGLVSAPFIDEKALQEALDLMDLERFAK